MEENNPNQADDKSAQTNRDLLNAFVGNNYLKITTRHYNIPAFFFGGLYLMYRKMLWPGIILVILTSVISNIILIIPNPKTAALVSFLVFIIVSFGLCFFFNQFYLKFAKKRMAKIKSENPDLNEKDLKNLYAEKGSTSGGWVFGGIGILILISIGCNLFMDALGLKNNQTNTDETFILETQQSNDDQDDDSSDTTFKGGLSYDTSVNIDEIYSLSIPNQFTDNSTAYRYDYEFAEDMQSALKCTVALSALKDFTNAEELINQMVGFYSNNSPSEAQSTQLADQTWYWFSRSNVNETTYDYATNNDGKVYLLEYTVVENDEAPGCSEFRTQILDSLQQA